LRKSTDSEIQAALARLPMWRRAGDWLRTSYRFATLADAVAFTMQLATLAERQRHHPEWTVRYRVVDIATTTHDVGGISARCFTLAAAIAALAAEHGGTPESPAVPKLS
jgi:4a-hydroxytetrahydrobiopterin dehydratase